MPDAVTDAAPGGGRLIGRTAVVTGAANGIGRATAVQMIGQGARVVLVDRDRIALDELGAALGPQAVPVAADVFAADDRARIVAAAVRTGTPDILVNCVGGSTGLERPNLPLAEMTEAQWDGMIAFNLKSTFLCCHDLIPHLRRCAGAAIVSLSSISGRGITPESGVAYATAKAGIVGFTRRLAVELADVPVRCNAVAPGYVMTERIRANVWDAAGEGGRRDLIRRIPIGRLADPEEIAALIVFLASDDASYLTGTTFDCNGGIVSP